MFSLKSCVGSGLISRSLIRFEFIFVDGVRECQKDSLNLALRPLFVCVCEREREREREKESSLEIAPLTRHTQVHYQRKPA